MKKILYMVAAGHCHEGIAQYYNYLRLFIANMEINIVNAFAHIYNLFQGNKFKQSVSYNHHGFEDKYHLYVFLLFLNFAFFRIYYYYFSWIRVLVSFGTNYSRKNS